MGGARAWLHVCPNMQATRAPPTSRMPGQPTPGQFTALEHFTCHGESGASHLQQQGHGHHPVHLAWLCEWQAWGEFRAMPCVPLPWPAKAHFLSYDAFIQRNADRSTLTVAWLLGGCAHSVGWLQPPSHQQWRRLPRLPGAPTPSESVLLYHTCHAKAQVGRVGSMPP